MYAAVLEPREAARVLEPARDERATLAARALDSSRDRFDVVGIGAHRGVARSLVQGPMRRHDARRAARQRLDHRDAEALEPRRIDERRCAAVEGRKLVVAGVTEPAHAASLRLDAAPAARADDAQLDAEALRGRDRVGEILPRLERSHGEQVVTFGARAVRRERGIDTGIGDMDAVAVD